MIQPPSHEDQLHLVGEAEELIVYRAVTSDDRESSELLDSLRSNAALGRPPRSREKTHPLIHSGISTWDSLETAIAVARMFPGQGAFVAEIRLHASAGAQYYRWGSAGHLTIWAEALMIREEVVDIFPIEG